MNVDGKWSSRNARCLLLLRAARMSEPRQVAARASLIEQLMSKRNFEDLGNHLAELEALPVTKEHLQETAVVRAVYSVLRNCPTVALKKKAKRLLSEWRALHKDLRFSPRDSPPSLPPGRMEEKPGLPRDPSQDELSGGSSSNSSSHSVAGALEMLVPENSTSHMEPRDEHLGEPPDPAAPVRARCTELLYEALTSACTDRPKADVWQDLAREIEGHLFTLHSKNLRKYKTCVRSKVANLKNPQNSHLQQNLLSGTTSPREFAEMTAMEMASEELKQLRASYTKSGIREHHLPQAAGGTPTGKIKCRRCEKFNCEVTVIARGTLFLPSWVRNSNPDEEMMTYVICNECGEQWYHSKWVCL
ncbi:transcription elongation factor A N-terminal and central domain-containing protein [Lutra lutra]|uniref:transcription elongation factor A N-terminal and central domain-containing protein n=1 Tax=Lutra lutra TaxID=9657 RepID=UPI001FCFA2DC|nr:transcription elongation factor A N-terminal and central domain-containing protein [Lutra lutra]XP_047572397.1 transcription elongation factor A N-terminal and central domain-containing protein [Lutra lutra]XP_047572399.1 transcription elongation factor A N-terminal and central domain-containing protein [Lutra lutra]XP_047572400.1 transcription elongation factor A N-terminal and central domain-containing protein [Lutra lutra]XP_047572401.1 transcription elongation factor A N-terminal and cen